MSLRLLAIPLLFLTGCVGYSHISDSQGTWVSQRVLWKEDLYYCVANKLPDSFRAKPICYEVTDSNDMPILPDYAPAPEKQKAPFIGH